MASKGQFVGLDRNRIARLHSQVMTSTCENSLKPGSHWCDKHNTSDISTSISTRKKKHVPCFLCLCLCRLCYAYRTSANQA